MSSIWITSEGEKRASKMESVLRTSANASPSQMLVCGFVPSSCTPCSLIRNQFHLPGEVAELQKHKVVLSSSSLRLNQSIVGDRGQLASSRLTSKWTHKCNCTGKYENISSLENELSVDSGTFFYGTNNDIDEEHLQDRQLLKAVVKVFCISAEPDYSLPWQLQRQYATTGSGFVISGRRILTNAHCVEHYTQVTVKKTGDDTKYIATVLSVGAECDLALLTVEDNEFWKDVEPLEFGGLPSLQDAVTVVGYPLGGDTVSVTKGVVSRVEVTPYAHGDSELLAVQIDAAINPGNSGGPAFDDDGDCVGIAFQVNSSAENIGYIIPTPIIHHFLRDYNMHGKYTGFPSLGIIFQKLENPHLRASLKMSSKQKGILIRKIDPTSPSRNILREV